MYTSRYYNIQKVRTELPLQYDYTTGVLLTTMASLFLAIVVGLESDSASEVRMTNPHDHLR